MANLLKKQNNLNNFFLIKSRKVISIFIVFFLMMTVMDSATSSSVFKSENPNDVYVENSKEQIDDDLEEENNETQPNEEYYNRDPKTFRRITLTDAIERYITIIRYSKTSLFKFYTNFSGNESQHVLKLFRFVNIDVNDDGKSDISVKIRLYPYLEKDICLSINFEYLIKRLDDFPDNHASFEAYGELYFPGILLKKHKGDRIRIGYESPEGEEVPSKCSITYKYLPNIIRLRKRPAHRAKLNPGSSRDSSKLILLFSYTNFQFNNIVSEIRSKTSYDPAVRSLLTIGGDGILGGSKFEFLREISNESKIDMTVAFLKNNTEIIGYVKDLPEKVTFTFDQGKKGFVVFDTHANPPTEIGLCDDFIKPKNFVYFKDLPSKATIHWIRDIKKQEKFNISFYTEGPGISFLGHFDLIANGGFDFNISSKENLDCSFSIDRKEGYLRFERNTVNISFFLSYLRLNTSFDLSFNLSRLFDKPFEINFSKFVGEEVNISLASKSFTLEDFKMVLKSDSGNFGIHAGKLIKEKNGSIMINFSYVKGEGNITLICEISVINGLNLNNFSFDFNGIKSTEQDIILVGNSTRVLEFDCESGGFEYFVAEDSSWGYFFFKGNFSYASYRDFTINNITGGFKGKIIAKGGNTGLNISWHTENLSGYNITKINVSGMFFGLENFHAFYGEIIDFYVPHLYGNIFLKEVCNESGYFYIELLGGQSYIDLNYSFNFPKKINTSGIELILKIEDFHLDHGDKLAYFEMLWSEKNLSSLVIHSENNINLSIKNMYIYIGSNGTPIFEINNLTGYLKGYSGFNLDISTPLNSYLTKKPKYLDSSNYTLSFELADVELDFEVDNITIAIPIGGIKIAAKTTGTVKFGFLNVSRDIETIYAPSEVNVSWGNITLGFDATYGELDLYEFEHINVNILIDIFLRILAPNFTGLPATTFKIENLQFSGYSKIIISLGSLNNSHFFLGIKLENDVDTYFNLGSMFIKLPKFPINDQYTKAYLDNLKLGEGTFAFILGLGSFGVSCNVVVTKRIQDFEIGAEISNIFEFNVSLDTPIEYFNLEVNPGINAEGINYLLLDTKNSTVGLNVESRLSSELINCMIDLFNNNTNITIPYVESDKGIRINHATLKADYFQVYSNLSDRPLYKGFLQIYGDGSIYHLVNNSWEPLVPGGDGFSFIIEENHLQLKFDMAIEDYPIDFEVIFDDTGNRIIFSGLFTVYSDDLTFDIWWNLENEYIKIISSNDRSIDIEDFSFQLINNNSIEMMNITTSLISILNGNYNLLLDNEKNIFNFDFGGSALSIKEFDLELYLINLSNIGNSTVSIKFDSFSILNGFAAFQSYLGSEEYNWSIGSDNGIDWFELVGLEGLFEGIAKPFIHFEAGIGLLKWNRTSNNFLKMHILKNASEGYIKLDRHSNMNGSFTIQDVYIRYITPNLKIPIGPRLRSLTVENKRNDHEYLNLKWKKEDYIEITADIAATWKVTFERFFDILNLIKRIDFVSSSIDANFSLRYEPPPDIYHDYYLKLNIHEESCMELLEIVNHFAMRFDKIITIGKMHFNPGEISFNWRIYEDQGIGFINVDNDELTGEFAGLTLRKGFYEIKLLDVSIIKPEKTFMYFNISGYLYIDNSAELEFTLLEFTEGIDLLRLERDLDFGVISMLPGLFEAEWKNLSDDDYDKEVKINNGIFELTVIKFVLHVGKLKVSLSLLDTDREYNNPIIVKLRQRGQGNRGFCITTYDPLQFDLFSIKMSGASWEFIIDLLELKADFNEWYLGMWDGKLTIGGNGTVKIVNLSRFINMTFKWKGEDDKEQKIFSQYCNYWQNHPQAHAILIDTTNCTEQLDVVYNTKINELYIDNQLTIHPQKYFTLHFDINPEPYENSADGHIFIDTNDQEIGNLSIEINKYVEYYDVDVGLYADIELLKANEFYIWGEFVEIEIFGFEFWIPSDWGKSGSIDFVNIGLVKLIFGSYETEIWPCTPKAISDKNQYGVTPENPSVVFDTSDSEGFAFKLQWMRWDWDGDGSWDTGFAPFHWIGFEESIEHDFSDLIENEDDSTKVFFQVKTVAAVSNIAEMTVVNGYTLDVDIEYDGEKLYESKEFKVIVSNTTSNAPVSNAYVEYHQFNIDGSENVSTNYTDSNGEACFIASEVPFDYYTHYSTARIYIEANGFFDCESELFKVYDTDADLHGYIRDNITHMGVSDALIVAEPGGYYTYSEEYFGWQNGKFKLLVPPGIYDITISKDGFSYFIIEEFNAIEGGYQNLGDLYLAPNDYGGLRGIVYDAANNDELMGVKVTVEIPGEDDIVTTTDYFGEFPNNYPSSDEYYSIDLEPGTYKVKFEFNNYYTYTEQVTICAGDVTEINVYLCPEWVTPFGHNNPSEWHDEEEAHDDQLNTASYTDRYWGLTWHWTEPLELFLPSSYKCDKLRIYAKYIENRCDQTKVEIYYNNAWHEVYTGSFDHKSWYEIEFDNEYIISKARISFCIKKYLGVPTNAELYEFNFGFVPI